MQRILLVLAVLAAIVIIFPLPRMFERTDEAGVPPVQLRDERMQPRSGDRPRQSERPRWPGFAIDDEERIFSRRQLHRHPPLEDP